MSLKIGFLPAILMLAACTPQPKAPVNDAIVRLPAVAGRPGAAYFTLYGGDKGRTLVSVASPAATRAAMHDMTMSNGMMSMAPITGGVVVPAKSDVRFQSGGKHVMLFGLSSSLKPGDAVQLTFRFANGETANLSAKAEAPGGGDEHSH